MSSKKYCFIPRILSLIRRIYWNKTTHNIHGKQMYEIIDHYGSKVGTINISLPDKACNMCVGSDKEEIWWHNLELKLIDTKIENNVNH